MIRFKKSSWSPQKIRDYSFSFLFLLPSVCTETHIYIMHAGSGWDSLLPGRKRENLLRAPEKEKDRDSRWSHGKPRSQQQIAGLRHRNSVIRLPNAVGPSMKKYLETAHDSFPRNLLKIDRCSTFCEHRTSFKFAQVELPDELHISEYHVPLRIHSLC